LILLGSTGSIGVNTLKIAKQFKLNVEVLVAGKNIDLLNKQIKIFKPSMVVIANKSDIPRVNFSKVTFGEEAILEVIAKAKSKLVVNALVGFLGLKPSLEAIKNGKKLALANKESLVVAGKFLDTKKIVPIDSEHFGLWYLWQEKAISSMIITASGGAFRDLDLKDLKNVSVEDALRHPSWEMGSKITIDSATMVNKVFELLEASWLFDISKIDAIIERKSLVHAFVNFLDGSTTAHLARANMCLPIAYALLEKIDMPILEPLDLLEFGALKFEEISSKRYAIWEYKDKILQNKDLGLVLNAANEVAVAKFLNKEIPFLDISKICIRALEKFENIKLNSLEEVFSKNDEVRSFCAT